MGRPAKYLGQTTCDIVENECVGFTHADMTVKLGISHQTFCRWLREHSEFGEAVKRADEVTPDIVESAFIKRCTGFEYEETKTEMMVIAKDGDEARKIALEALSDGDEDAAVFKVTVTNKIIVPDTAACIFYLTNMKKEKYRHMQHFKHDIGNDTMNYLRKLRKLRGREAVDYLEDRESK